MMQELSTIDDLPATNVELEPEKFEDGKDGGPSFRCDLYDTELVHKIAQVFIPGLSTACVDNTAGDIFRTPASVAADVRKEMVEYMTGRSQNFVAESIILEGGPDAQVSDHPYDIISDFVDDFASSKRNLFGRISGWLLSEKREDKIDDFVQEMEINAFWLIDRREAIAQTLLRNVDFMNEHHCNMKFNTPEQLAEHASNCSFRSMTCTNEGCTTKFTASHMEKHDSTCPYKIIPCEQNCSNSIMRREMDRHCITVCPMKLVICPFYAVGCQSPVPHCQVEQHRSHELYSHLLFILQIIHKEASEEDLKKRLEQLEKASSTTHLAEARDVRSFTSKVKDIEAKLGPMKVSSKLRGDVEAKPGSTELSNAHPDVDEANLRPKEVSSEIPEDNKAKLRPNEVIRKPAEDLEAKHVQEGANSKPPENVQTKLGPKEVTSKPLKDLEGPPDYGGTKLGPKETSSKCQQDLEAKLGAKELGSKPQDDVETKLGPNEVSNKPLELGPTEVNSKRPKDLEAKQGLEEVSSKLPEDFDAKLGTGEVSTKPPENVDAKLRPKETNNEHLKVFEAKLRPEEVSGKLLDVDLKLRPKERNSEHSEDSEAKRGPMKVSNKQSEVLEAELGPTEMSSKDSEERKETLISETVLEEA